MELTHLKKNKNALKNLKNITCGQDATNALIKKIDEKKVDMQSAGQIR